VEQNGFPVRRSGTREFIWTKTLTETPYNVFRVPNDNDPRVRTAVEICPEEIANAAAQILIRHISMDQDDLMRETANLFGITKLGTNVRSSFEQGIDLMKKNGMCQVNEKNLVAL
jgi:hypothetical protein